MWINPNPTYQFGAQTINLSSTDFDYLIVNVIRNISNTNRRLSYIVEKGTSSDMSYSDRSGDFIRTWNRVINNSAISSIDFDECYLTQSMAINGGMFESLANKDLLVPYTIYGFKY